MEANERKWKANCRAQQTVKIRNPVLHLVETWNSRYEMKKLFVIALALLSGCATLESLNSGRFEIIEDEKFVYHVESPPVEMPEVSPESEEERMKWLQAHLDLNEMCERGFEIVKRRPTAIRQTLSGKRYRIAYLGKCKE